MVDWCRLSNHGRFHLLRPFHHIAVGLASTATLAPMVAEVDFTSFFFQFQWSESLARAHTFRAHGKSFAFVAPVQGSAVMPLVAQVTTATLARAPLVSAGPWEWVDRGVSIIYDNILLSGEAAEVRARWADLETRCEQIGAVRGDTQPPGYTLTSCGFEFDVSVPEDRRWRLSTAWTGKVANWCETTFDPENEQHREIFAGVTQWALNASLIPLAFARKTLQGLRAEDERQFIMDLLNKNLWRRMRAAPTQYLPDDATLVVTDGSMNGAGIVMDGKAFALEWKKTHDGRTAAQRVGRS